MPGNILVSVLELIDLPITPHSKVEGNNNEHIVLKVSMGKREYQTTGTGDFSFTVLSLRENLVFTLHDVEGNELSRTDVRTMQVVEKGIWDAWFLFDRGGSVHLKLQFSITDGDRKRVHEMRESALMRKYANLLDSASLSPKSSTKPHQADLIDQLQQIAPVLDFNHQLVDNELVLYHTEASRKALVEHNEPQVRTEQFLKKDTYSVQLPLADVRQIGQSSKDQPTRLRFLESIIPRKLDRDALSPSPPLHLPLTGVREIGDSSESDVHTKFEPLRSFDSGKSDGGLLYVSSNVAKNEEPVRTKKLNRDASPANKVKNMISAFEKNLSQEMKSQRLPSESQVISRSKEIHRTSSSQGPLLAEANTVKAQDGEILTKSFSAGMLFDVNMQKSPLDDTDKEKMPSSINKISTIISKNIEVDEDQNTIGKLPEKADIEEVQSSKILTNSSHARITSAFEKNLSQEMKSQRFPSESQVISCSKEIHRTSSSQRPLLAEANTVKAQDGEILTKSFSAGMLFDVNMQKSPLDDTDKEKMPSSSINKISTIISKNIVVDEDQNTIGKLPEKADIEEVQSSKILTNSSHARITSAFEKNLSQEMKSQRFPSESQVISRSKEIHRTSSSQGPLLAEANTVKAQDGEILTKSFSAGMLFDVNMQNAPLDDTDKEKVPSSSINKISTIISKNIVVDEDQNTIGKLPEKADIEEVQSSKILTNSSHARITSAFEKNLSQEMKSQRFPSESQVISRSKEIHRTSSSQGPLLAEANTVKAQDGEILTKSFSAGMLFDVNMQKAPLDDTDKEKVPSSSINKISTIISKNIVVDEDQNTIGKLPEKADIEEVQSSKILTNSSHARITSAFEKNLSQEMKSQRFPSESQVISCSKEIHRTSSSQGPLLAEANTVKAQDGEILTKSFSAGMLFDVNMQKSPLDDTDKEKMPSSSINKISTIIRKNIEVDEDQNTIGKLPEKADIEEVQSSKIPTNSSHARITSEVKVKPSPEYLELLDKKEQDEESNISVINQENPNINQDIMELKNIGAEMIVHDDMELKNTETEMVVYDTQETERDNKVDAQEQWETTGMVISVVSKENIEPCNVLMYEEQSVLEERVKGVSRNESSECTCRSSTPLLDFVSEAFFVGYPDFGMKRRICITTCTKTMMDLVGRFNIPVEACPTVSDAIKLSFSDEHTDDPSTDMIRDDTVPSCSRKLEAESSLPKYKGKLIKQVIRITVMVMACGAFILKIR